MLLTTTKFLTHCETVNLPAYVSASTMGITYTVDGYYEGEYVRAVETVNGQITYMERYYGKDVEPVKGDYLVLSSLIALLPEVTGADLHTMPKGVKVWHSNKWSTIVAAEPNSFGGTLVRTALNGRFAFAAKTSLPYVLPEGEPEVMPKVGPAVTTTSTTKSLTKSTPSIYTAPALTTTLLPPSLPEFSTD